MFFLPTNNLYKRRIQMKKNVLKKVFSIVIIVAMLLYYVPGECYADSQAENTDKR